MTHAVLIVGYIVLSIIAVFIGVMIMEACERFIVTRLTRRTDDNQRILAGWRAKYRGPEK